MHKSSCGCTKCQSARNRLFPVEAFEGEFSSTSELLSEAEEMELAMELLGVSNEDEMDQFLGKMFKGIGRGLKKAGRFLRKKVLPKIGGALKGLAKKALPFVGGLAPAAWPTWWGTKAASRNAPPRCWPTRLRAWPRPTPSWGRWCTRRAPAKASMWRYRCSRPWLPSP